MYVDSSRYGDLSVLVVTVVTVDGRADVVDGALIGLYVIIAAIFWWVEHSHECDARECLLTGARPSIVTRHKLSDQKTCYEPPSFDREV